MFDTIEADGLLPDLRRSAEAMEASQDLWEAKVPGWVGPTKFMQVAIDTWRTDSQKQAWSDAGQG